MTKPEILYHYSAPDNRESILTLGLSTLFDQTGYDAIFLTDVLRPQPAMDCWEVDVRGLCFEPDETGGEVSGEAWWQFDESISPCRLRLVNPNGEAATPSPRKRVYGMFASATDRPKLPWNHIYGNRFQVDMCGADPIAIEVRIIDAPDPGCYFAWHDFKRDALSHVYPTELMVRMCDPGGFGPATARGEGNVVAVTIAAHKG
ncbi:hypothetical protein F6X40_10045 [Paraburkholderia sp. UCT31]|uniref:hypothetical protein n=1 Tax=Paraburkholderia sp. UCT31 TaxID=2615209 RepID=UPI001654E8ED|nr:hypothetical protein [Paraburkholderia sp. UCT31]MBC8737148.1 hypothetical protein [Paraburkholderia sp. UCT31]